MNVLERIFLNSRNFVIYGKTEFFVRCRRTYVLNNSEENYCLNFMKIFQTNIFVSIKQAQ